MAAIPQGIENESDESLMGRVQSGDHRAFATLVRRHTNRFYACAYRLCSQRDQAEDIVQEAFLKLWDKPQAWDATRGVKFTTWFYRVVTNLTLDGLRKRKPEQGSDTLDYLESGDQNQEAGLQEREQQHALEKAIQNLPERQKAALNLCFYEGLSNKEAAEIIGVGLKGLESLLMRAKAGVRDELIRQGFVKQEENGKLKYG